MCINSDSIEICFKLASNGQSDTAFLLTSKLCPYWIICPCPGAIYMYKTLKIYIKSDFKEILLKLTTNGHPNKAFLWTSKLCPQGIVCPCPAAVYMYKIIENVYEIRLQRDLF